MVIAEVKMSRKRVELKRLIGAELKDADKGEVLVRFATLNVVDQDGDWTEPGAFGEQKVLVSTYNHGTSLYGQPPVGTGIIREEGDAAIGELRYFLDQEEGRKEFDVVKMLLAEGLGEWSYRYQVLEAGRPNQDQRAQGAVRVLKRLRVIHVAPVEAGAGVGTATLAAKAAGELEDPALTEAVKRALSKQFSCPFPFETFDACVRRMSREEGVDDPEGLCAEWHRTCETRAAALRELARFERTRHRLGQ